MRNYPKDCREFRATALAAIVNRLGGEMGVARRGLWRDIRQGDANPCNPAATSFQPAGHAASRV